MTPYGEVPAPYESPYGRAAGLAARLSEWITRVGQDRTLPWVGLGLVGDMRMAVKFLSSREFLEYLRIHGDAEQADHARDLLASLDTVEAVEDAVYRAADKRDLGPDAGYTDPPRAVELLADDAQRCEARAAESERRFNALRDVLVETGALHPDDTDTPLDDLLRALLA